MPDADLGPRASIRELARHEIPQIWSIDRAEVIERVYYLEGGQLTRKPERHEVRGWRPDQEQSFGPILLDCFDHGGTFYAAFEGQVLVGVAVVEGRFIGRAGDRLQLKFLHVSRAQRGAGLGRALFEMAAARARELGARQLYVSSTPSENSVEFYLHRGCRLAREVDPVLFEVEPDDIHLELEIGPRRGSRAR